MRASRANAPAERALVAETRCSTLSQLPPPSQRKASETVREIPPSGSDPSSEVCSFGGFLTDADGQESRVAREESAERFDDSRILVAQLPGLASQRSGQTTAESRMW
jgi:hypothetical protein